MKLLILPALSAFIMGIVILLLNKAIGVVEYRLVTFLILLGFLILSTVLYMILLLVLRCVDEEDISGGFWGRILYKLGEILHIF